MLKKLVFCASLAMGVNSTYASQYAMTIDQSYQFPPNVKQSISNPVFWKVTLSCKVSTPDSEDKLYAKVTKKSGKINGQKLKVGETLTLPVKNGDTFTIEADGSAKVEITNLGHSLVKAKCLV